MKKAIDAAIEACRFEVDEQSGRVFVMVEVLQNGEIHIHPRLQAVLTELALESPAGGGILGGIDNARVNDVKDDYRKGKDDRSCSATKNGSAA